MTLFCNLFMDQPS